jgi:hypothetical protein
MVASELVVDLSDDSVPRMMTWADVVMAVATAMALTAKVMVRIFMMVPSLVTAESASLDGVSQVTIPKSSLLHAKTTHGHQGLP